MHRARKRTYLHQTVEFSSQEVFRSIRQLQGRDTDIERTDDDIVTTAREISQADLRGVLQVLGYAEASPASAVVTAFRSGKEEDAVLLLQLGVSPIDVGREWRSLHSTSSGDELPLHLKIWEDASIGRDYKTVDALTNEIMATNYISFASITWAWDAPAVLNTDIEDEVVLISSDLIDELDELHHVQAMTYQEYLAQSRWSDFVTNLLRFIKIADLNSTNNGQSN